MKNAESRGCDWFIHFHEAAVVVTTPQGVHRLVDVFLNKVRVRRRWFTWRVEAAGQHQSGVHLRGISRKSARALQQQLLRVQRDEAQRLLRDQLEAAQRQREHAEHERIAALRAGLVGELPDVERWYAALVRLTTQARKDLRWLTHDQVAALVESRPQAPHLRRLLGTTDADAVLTPRQHDAARVLAWDMEAERRTFNKTVEERLLIRDRLFFDTIEKSPLTDEQAKAVVCFDNRVQVIAAAGSGKTSVMVARAAYAIKRGLVPADRILLLAFNTNAAQELQERIAARLGSQGIDHTGLKASTFHAFGLALIGRATGTKPRLAPWLENGGDVDMVGRIVDRLREESASFRYRWDLYRLLFARAGIAPEGSEPEWWDRDSGITGHRTLHGETVRSQGEKMIADWLYLNGVAYEYERAYKHPVADAEHSQYRPDFYYPDVDVWHEHWALGKDGKPPKHFTNYAAGMAWKRDIHRRHATTLIETTWADIFDTSGFDHLARALGEHGIELDWNPDRPVSGSRPVEHEELFKLVRSFMTHVKSNSFTKADIEARMSAAPGTLGYRTRLFLDLYWMVHEAWEARLAADNYVDYDDMLVKAVDLLERGRATPGFDMVLVDEFQDSSAARARLVRALTNLPHRYMLAVGDDWQSIYRFAGSDVSVMTDFAAWFGPSEVRRLSTTFRSTQAISDAASAFVSRNPRQLAKTVTSAHGPGGPPLLLATVRATGNNPEKELAGAVEAYLHRVSQRVATGDIRRPIARPLTVDVLGRYKFERDLVPRHVPDGLQVTFRTIHQAKGLEADFVLIPRAISGTLGFPSRIESDPVLDLVMSTPDDYPFAEERRLLYVALTRARHEAAIITVTGKESPFVVELLKDGLITAVDPASASPEAVCPACRQSLLVARTGKFGSFWACTRVACSHTQSQPPT